MVGTTPQTRFVESFRAQVDAFFANVLGEEFYLLVAPAPVGSDPDGWPTPKNEFCLLLDSQSVGLSIGSVHGKAKWLLASKLVSGREVAKLRGTIRFEQAKRDARTAGILGYYRFPEPHSYRGVLLKLTPKSAAQLVMNGVLRFSDDMDRIKDAERH